MTRAITSGIQRLAGGSWIDLDEPTPRTMHRSLDEAQRARAARLWAPEFWEYALFKRSNGHQVGGPVRVREAADPRLRGLKPERYVIRRRPVYSGPWEDA